MTDQTPHIFTIPSGTSFVDVLAQGLLERVDYDPLKLSEYILLLPSRRACRSLREAFLRLSKGQPILLPKMQPLGEIDAEELTTMMAGHGITIEGEDGQATTDIPPAISPLRRHLLLARLILKLHDQLMPTGRPEFDQAVALARELGSFLDQVQTEGLGFDNLDGLVPEEFAEHWQVTLDFLKIITEHWPNILAEEGVVDPAQRRNLILQAQATFWRAQPSKYPVIAAGVTGSVPMVSELMTVIANMDNGEVVLPGLDHVMDDPSWDILKDDHPQFYLKQFLAQAGIARHDVKIWGGEQTPLKRHRLMSELMRPVESTEKWQALSTQDIDENAIENLIRIDCTTAQEEADTIALIMREALEDEEKTTALITPDRRLARRVAMALRRWGIMVDDSGGQKLSETPIGVFWSLTMHMMVEQSAPVPLLACLKHPLASCGMRWAEFQEILGELERRVLRGVRPPKNMAGLRTALNIVLDEMSERNPDQAQTCGQRLNPLLDEIETRTQAMADVLQTGEAVEFSTLLKIHVDMVQALAQTDQEWGKERLWCREDGEAATRFINELYQFANDIPPLTGREYLDVMEGLMAGQMVRPRYGQHPRLSILGQLEARLYNADLVILGGVNEGTWPADIGGDPWMSRQMRQQFGLPSPERQTSIAAHDFVQAASAQNVIMTRALRQDGAPTVVSRWLLRLTTVLQASGLELDKTKPHHYKQWVQLLDKPANDVPLFCARPEPTPPVSARPRQLSVTKIETWMRDPYDIYASQILKLKALDPVDDDPSPATRGNIIHDILEEFINKTPSGALPATAYDDLLALGREGFERANISPEVQAFWWPRFEKAANGFVEEELKRRTEGRHTIKTEVKGHMSFTTTGGAFTLTAKADRIDKLPDGTLEIIDYKTGSAPSKKEVTFGYAPQLPLEAVITQDQNGGGFEGVENKTVSHVGFWLVSGGNPPFKTVYPYDDKKNDIQQNVEMARQGLHDLVEFYDDPNTSYPSRPIMDKAPRYSDFEHFARIKEWGSALGEED